MTYQVTDSNGVLVAEDFDTERKAVNYIREAGKNVLWYNEDLVGPLKVRRTPEDKKEAA